MAMRKDSIALTTAEISDLGTAAKKDVGAAKGQVITVGDTLGIGDPVVALPTSAQEKGAHYAYYDGDIGYGGSGVELKHVLRASSAATSGLSVIRMINYFNRDRKVIGVACFGASEEWRVNFYHSGNTTQAADGTLKAASPVIRLFHDGRAVCNEESEGCAVERLGVGEYLISGCIGLNSDAAWGGVDGGFDIPKDRNRQPLIWLDYKVNPDGSVLVKTYHRTHPGAPEFARNEREGFNEGDPIDIPADQYVSIRVEMPVDSIWNQRQLEAAAAMAEATQDEQPDIQQQ
ncbi:hypothetical protein LO739_04510 [Leclercia adecarboxylata]|uniref:phage tail fiber protein n=1 Tax=Leclercia adecarboxylata TaxID=83655 RepID=UPI001E60927A|nr:hypothetical protein [Leclercia adecarboxylata]UFM70452.1 hypothetical protein LO739_04510 [Leclercia adecarboxylata]